MRRKLLLLVIPFLALLTTFGPAQAKECNNPPCPKGFNCIQVCMPVPGDIFR
jgi:hypothetical protein